MIDRGLRRGFDPAVEHEARESAASGGAPADGRRDLRELPTFTIDPASARDFDDAISAERIGDGDDAWRVWVHIADVSAYVAPRSLVDREAYRRGTSVYVPGAVEPMLPKELSNNVCSLVPGQDRNAVTVEMTVRGRDVARASFYRSVIRSDAAARVRRRSIGSSPGRRVRPRPGRSPWPRRARRRQRSERVAPNGARSCWSHPSPISGSTAAGTSSAPSRCTRPSRTA